MNNKSTEIDWINNLKALATFAVIVLHVVGPILYQYGAIDSSDWYIGHFFDSFVRFCVPVFLMITGVLLLSNPIKIDAFLKKRLVRVIYPFLFWSIIYILLSLIIKNHKGEFLNSLELVKFIYIQLKSGASYHLWYIYMLIGIYLFLPVISTWILNSKESEIRYFIFLWVLVLFFRHPYFSHYTPSVDWTYFSGYIGYPVLGYYLSHFFKRSKALIFSAALFGIGVFFTFAATCFLTIQKGVFDEVFYDYLSPNVLLSSVGFFCFFMRFDIKNIKLRHLINLISKNSYGIYLSHVVVLIFLDQTGLNWNFINPLFGIVLSSILCLFFSLFLVVILKKIPFGRFIVG